MHIHKVRCIILHPPPPLRGAHSLWAQLGETVLAHHTGWYRQRTGGARATSRPPQPHSRHVMCCRWTRRDGDTAYIALAGYCSWPKASRITSDDIRLNEVTNWPKTCKFVIMIPASCCNWSAADTASSWFMWWSQYPGERLSRRADSGAPTYSKKRGWCSWSP